MLSEAVVDMRQPLLLLLGESNGVAIQLFKKLVIEVLAFR